MLLLRQNIGLKSVALSIFELFCIYITVELEKFRGKIWLYIVNFEKCENERKRKMKKHISTIILIVLCIVCVIIFYVNAAPLSKGSDQVSSESESSSSESSSLVEEESERPILFNQSGTVRSERLSNTNLRGEWNAIRYKNEETTYFSIEIYLDTDKLTIGEHKGVLYVNGDKIEFSTTPHSSKDEPICTYTKAYEGVEELNFEISCELNISVSESNGVNLNKIELNGNAVIGERLEGLAESVIIEIEHISQYPTLPSGDEITSLAMVLKHLKYNVNAEELCDLYLAKGPVGFTSFFEANVGNPRDTYNSYGCLAPVIKDSANKYIKANGGSAKAYDISGCDVNELYCQLNNGNPVIVWACEDFEITPSVSRIWVVDGVSLYYKANMACMVLIGYDNTKNTVTLSNPAGGIFSIDKDLFELRFSEVGSYAVTVY